MITRFIIMRTLCPLRTVAAGARPRLPRTRPIEVGRNCWIGMSALILPGVRIGDGCVLGAGAVLTKDLDDYTIAVGNPARPIRSRR